MWFILRKTFCKFKNHLGYFISYNYLIWYCWKYTQCSHYLKWHDVYKIEIIWQFSILSVPFLRIFMILSTISQIWHSVFTASLPLTFQGYLHNNILKRFKYLNSIFKAKLPEHWTPMTSSSVYELIPLADKDKEYLEVSKEFQKTCKGQILKVAFWLSFFSLWHSLLDLR